jgi:hypothetical protein
MSQPAPSLAAIQGTTATAVAASATQAKPAAEQNVAIEKQDTTKKKFIKNHAGLTTVPVKVGGRQPCQQGCRAIKLYVLHMTTPPCVC